jgi:hypothetical protein
MPNISHVAMNLSTSITSCQLFAQSIQYWLPGKMGSFHVTFAETLKAADKPTHHPQADPQFHHFSKLPTEIRFAVWESILLPPEDEPPALFCERHSVTWTDSNGYLEQPDAKAQVPIHMTTTCAALLHVSKETRQIVLKWADALGYKLCFRILPFDFDEYDGYGSDADAGEDSEKNLPVQGPIFTRGWDASKDILNMFWTADDYGIPDEWADEYLEGEKVHNVQHLAFSVDDMKYCLNSRWFYQLLIATPDLKSISFDYDTLMEGDGETFHVRFLETAYVGDPWAPVGGAFASAQDNKLRRRSYSTQVRWEPAPCDRKDESRFKKMKFKEKLKDGFRYPDNWPPTEGDDDSSDDGSTSNKDNRDAFERLPPWVWDREKDDFAFELRAPFQMVERRGYDDVRGGLVVNCGDHYNTQ